MLLLSSMFCLLKDELKCNAHEKEELSCTPLSQVNCCSTGVLCGIMCVVCVVCVVWGVVLLCGEECMICGILGVWCVLLNIVCVW